MKWLRMSEVLRTLSPHAQSYPVHDPHARVSPGSLRGKAHARAGRLGLRSAAPWALGACSFCSRPRAATERTTPSLPAAKGAAPSLVARCLAMAARAEEQLRRRAENERRRYTTKRLASLKQRFPGIPSDVLGRATLRQVSVAVRNMGDGQRTLIAFSEQECSSGSVSKQGECLSLP